MDINISWVDRLMKITIFNDSYCTGRFNCEPGQFISDVMNKNIKNLLTTEDEKNKKSIKIFSKEIESIEFDIFTHIIENTIMGKYENITQKERTVMFLASHNNFQYNGFLNYNMNCDYICCMNFPDNDLASCEFKIPNLYMGMVYYFSTIDDVLKYLITDLIEHNECIKKCENCGKYFNPSSRSDEIYCNNIFKNNKTCKQLGYEIKLNQDIILKPYRIIYKTQNARKQRNKHKPNIDERFSKWSKYAHSVLKQCQDGEITVEEMKKLISGTEWLNNNAGESYGNNNET